MVPATLRHWHTWQRALWHLVHEPQAFAWKTYRLLRPMRPAYRRRFGMRLGQWLVYHNQTIAFTRCSWMGVQTIKNPLDTWIYQEILYELQPDVVIEIGSYSGGSTLYLAHLLDLLGKGQVISIDIDRSCFQVTHPRIVTITGDSAAPATLHRVQELCCGKTVLVIHDGDHAKEQVLKDLRSYAPLVSRNSYLIVEDGIIDLFKPGDSLGRYMEGPLIAIEQFLKEAPDFEVDRARERYLLTYNVQGFLKRVRGETSFQPGSSMGNLASQQPTQETVHSEADTSRLVLFHTPATA